MKPEYLTFLAIAIAAASFLASHYRTKSVSDIVERVAKLETRVEVYFDLQEKYNAAILHRPDHKDVDQLLEERADLKPLSEDQDKKLDDELEKIINDDKQTVGFRAAAAQMLAARKARNECS